MFGKSSLSKDHAAIVGEMERGERHVPQHKRPKSIADSGFTSFITPHMKFFPWTSAGSEP